MYFYQKQTNIKVRKQLAMAKNGHTCSNLTQTGVKNTIL